MSAILVYRGKEYPVPAGQSLADALRSLGLNPESFLAVREGEMIAMTEPLREGDAVKLVAVMSGG